MINLLIADAQIIFLEGLTTTLASTDIKVVSRTTVVSDVLGQYKLHKPDVVLCDIQLGNEEINGFDVLADLLSFDREAKVIMFSQFDQDTNIHETYEAGAKCFLMKSVKVDDLVAAIKKVAEGEIYFTEEIAKRIASYSILKKGKSIKDILNTKELEMLRYFAEGMSDKEIAELLKCHLRTVTTHKAAIKEKLSITRNAEMTKIAIKHNIISLDA